MPFRLLVNLRGRGLRFPLAPGELVVGSSSEADIRLKHPSVSRRHARLVVTAQGVFVEDTGSANGTRIDGRTLNGERRLDPGTDLRFGSVDAVLEEVGDDDIEVAIQLEMDITGDATDISRGAVSTVGPAILEDFTVHRLPELAESVARGLSRSELAQEVGAALMQTMPCASVEVSSRGGNGEGIVFAARQEVSGDLVPLTLPAGGDLELKVELIGKAVAESCAPLLRTAAALVRAAGRGPDERGPRIEMPVNPPAPPPPPSIVASFREIYRQAARIARGGVSVLIRGESGTGKELLARYLHAASRRADSPLVTLNCAALPRDLLESELFGVERGVATGVDARLGKFEAAHGGTLFLDEIGDMAPETQARILRVLAEGEVFRIGGHEPRPANARIISATNRDINAMMEDGAFRTDLYHRIADWVVELPPLRRRRADIPNLAAHFLGRACAGQGVRAAGISRAALDTLMAFHWPGNVRQLEREMARAALFLEDGQVLDRSDLQPAILENDAEAGDRSLKAVRERAEREHIRQVLDECGGAVAEAAEILDIGLSTLYSRMKDLGIG